MKKELKITYLGTTVLLFDDGRDQILFDCHFTRPSLIKTLLMPLKTDKKVAKKVMEDVKLDRLRAIFLSHSHYDHVLDMPYVARMCKASVYGSASTLNVARGGKVAEEKLHLFEHGDVFTVGAYKIQVIRSIHSQAHWYNDDLGQTIDEPLKQPAKKKAYKEGGSYDFLVEYGGKKILIRPSYNYLEGQLDGIKADLLFLGITGLGKDTPERKKKFFEETIDKVKPELVVPLHWDSFFSPLYKTVCGMPKAVENTGDSMLALSQYCGAHGASCVVVLPFSYLNYIC